MWFVKVRYLEQIKKKINLNKIQNFIVRKEKILTLLVLTIGIILIYLRNYSLLPMVMSDEYYHQLNYEIKENLTLK